MMVVVSGGSGCPPPMQPGQVDGSGRDMHPGPEAAQGGGKQQQQQYGRGHSGAQTTYSSACC